MTPDPDIQPQFYEGVPSKRLLAWVVDTLIIGVLTLLTIPFTLFISLFFLPFVFFMINFAYRVVTLSRGSATWGMRVMAIELRDAQDAPFDVSQTFLHTLGYSLSIMIAPLQLISMVLMLSTERRQGLTDILMGTVALNRRA